MASGDVEVLQLRRYDTSQPWGFRMQGGVDFGMPIYIAQVSPKGLADKAGARNGDAILEICGTSTQGWTHNEAKQAMLRAGNEVDFLVKRGVVNAQAMQSAEPGEQRVELDEGSIDPGMNEGSKYRNVMPKSYRILEAQLGSSATPEQQPQKPPAASEGPRPASIFDRKKQDRSDYLQAQGQTIQKAYGQKK